MKDIKNLRKSARKGNATKGKRNFDIFWNNVAIMTAPAIFQEIVLTSVAVAANLGTRAQTFANVTQKCGKTLVRQWR